MRAVQASHVDLPVRELTTLLWRRHLRDIAIAALISAGATMFIYGRYVSPPSALALGIGAGAFILVLYTISAVLRARRVLRLRRQLSPTWTFTDDGVSWSANDGRQNSAPWSQVARAESRPWGYVLNFASGAVDYLAISSFASPADRETFEALAKAHTRFTGMGG